LRKSVIVLFLFLCAVIYPQSVQLNLFEQDGLYGYKNQIDQIVIAAKFAMAMDFSEKGIAAVADSSGWAYIDTQGNILIRPFIYDNGPDYFCEDLARFVENGKFGFFDESGKIVIEAQWDFAYPFKDGKAAVCNRCKMSADNEHKKISGGEWGYIDKTGKIIISIGSVKADSVLNEPKNLEIFEM
jgi:hypothetical protein